MSTATERLLRRNVKMVQRRPGRPRELAFDATKSLLTWVAPADKRVPFTHYRVRVDTDSGKPAFELSAGQASVVLTSGSRVFVSAYNETTGLESAKAALEFTIGGVLGPVPDVLAFRAGKFDEDTQQWSDTMTWDTLKQFMLVDWGCMLPQDTSNWSAVAVFIKMPKDGGGFDYVPATDPFEKKDFIQSSDGSLVLYERIAVELKDVPAVPQQWTFIACSYGRDGVPRTDAEGNPTGPYVTLTTLAPPEKPITPDGKVNPDTFTKKLGIIHIDTANIDINEFTGQLPIARISNLGEFNISNFTGNLSVERIENLGQFNIANFAGNLPVERIDNLYSLNIGNFQGNLDVSRVANLGQFNIGNFQGVITTQQVQDGFLSDLRKFATELRPITKVAALPSPSDPAYPYGTVVLNLADSKLYRNVGYWAQVSASDTITGKLSSTDIASVNAATIIGQINVGVVQHIQLSQLSGTLSASQAAAINIGSFSGNLSIERIDNLGTLNINTFQGTIAAEKIASIVADSVTIIGGWKDGHIHDVNFSKLTVGTMVIGSGNVYMQGTGSLIVTGGGGITCNAMMCSQVSTAQLKDLSGNQVIDALNKKAMLAELTLTGQLKIASTPETGLQWLPVAKIPCYSEIGAWVGWIPVVQ